MSVVLASLILVAPIHAHTTTELDEWREGWLERVETTGMNRTLGAEWVDVMSRHLAYADKLPKPRPIVGNTRTTNVRVDRGMGSNVEQWRGLVASYFGAETDLALCVMLYESGGNPNARHVTSGAAGLFQIMPFWWDHFGGNRYDPATNVRVAKTIRDSQGWTAWAAYNRGKCD